ncbi:MAG: response regulator, partial [Sphaerochaeta sp.]
MRIVLVDDDELVLESLSVLLAEDEDVHVVGCAANGAEALELLGKLAVDVVLLDVQMPVMDGIEAAQRIKAQFPRIKILMLTTFAD